MNGNTKSPLATLPSVDRLLNSDAAAALIAEFGRAETTDALRDALSGIRKAYTTDKTEPPEEAGILALAGEKLQALGAPSLRPVFNLTGTVLHTNLGRAALPEEAIAAVAEAARGASNLEYRLAEGRRGDRD